MAARSRTYSTAPLKSFLAVLLSYGSYIAYLVQLFTSQEQSTKMYAAESKTKQEKSKRNKMRKVQSWKMYLLYVFKSDCMKLAVNNTFVIQSLDPNPFTFRYEYFSLFFVTFRFYLYANFALRSKRAAMSNEKERTSALDRLLSTFVYCKLVPFTYIECFEPNKKNRKS